MRMSRPHPSPRSGPAPHAVFGTPDRQEALRDLHPRVVPSRAAANPKGAIMKKPRRGPRKPSSYRPELWHLERREAPINLLGYAGIAWGAADLNLFALAPDGPASGGGYPLLHGETAGQTLTVAGSTVDAAAAR